ncbi:MAG: hypothetical protein C5B48_09870 [Candidatus Rokuibacteriota bacterium]|nr:MAG: hypothetical protein C5B48_09870 [Candidatus Rokubacteria bacterium]
MRKLGVLTLLVLTAVVGGSSGASTGQAPQNHVTMITDSVGGVLFWVTEARKELARGLDLDLETKTCRKLVVPGCPAYGDPAPQSVLDTVRALGDNVGPTVVIDVGYNDQADVYAAGLDEVMQALIAAGAQHVVWVTLEEAQESWADINVQIHAASQRWPQLTVADWAVASAGKPWLSDGVHMTYEGGIEFAHFLRPFVLAACGQPCAPPPPLQIATTTLPKGRSGHRYAAAVTAQGGAPPYRWSVIGLPRGLHLSGTGHIAGVPRAAGESRLSLRVRDTWEDEAAVTVFLRVRR